MQPAEIVLLPGACFSGKIQEAPSVWGTSDQTLRLLVSRFTAWRLV